MHANVSDLIRFFVHHVPGTGRTQIVKFLYLADLESRRHLGRPLSDLRYIWYHYGPFAQEIYEHLDVLCERNVITVEQVVYPPDGKTGYRYSPANDDFHGPFS